MRARVENKPCGEKLVSHLGPIYMISGTRENPPLNYPGRANFSLISLKTSSNRLHENRELGWASCLASAGRVTLSGGTTFSHINTLARLPEARWLKLFPEPAILSNM